MELSEDFEYAIETYGPPQGGESVGPGLISAMEGKLPPSLLDFWGVHGIGMWLDGYFQLCDPRKYASIARTIFGKDPDFHPETTHLIGFSGMGVLLFWNQDHRNLHVNLPSLSVEAAEYFKPQPNVSADISIGVSLTSVEGKSYDLLDTDANYMFERLKAAHGPLKFGEVYAPKLHPALGGNYTVENIRPASALEAFALMAQAGVFELKDSTQPSVPTIRQIG